MPEVLVVVGTRPDAVKLAPVVAHLRRSSALTVRVCSTGQHRELLDPVLRLFELVPDVELSAMTSEGGLADLASRILTGVDGVLAEAVADAVVVQGDTTTALAAAWAARYRGVPVAHVEAGLRTSDILRPFPEELNRRLIGTLAEWHFAPTERAHDNLVRAGVEPDRISTTGNTVVDALAAVRVGWEAAGRAPFDARLAALAGDRRVVVVTCHRRESFGAGLQQLCTAVEQLVRAEPDLVVVWPVHPNPAVREAVLDRLDGSDRVHLVDPLDYPDFLALLHRATLVLTDSGGVQEEAPSFGRPVLVCREETEREEGVEAGIAEVVGTDPTRIVAAARRLLGDGAAYARMVARSNPYGDGRAAERIVTFLEDRLT